MLHVRHEILTGPGGWKYSRSRLIRRTPAGGVAPLAPHSHPRHSAQRRPAWVKSAVRGAAARGSERARRPARARLSARPRAPRTLRRRNKHAAMVVKVRVVPSQMRVKVCCTRTAVVFGANCVVHPVTVMIESPDDLVDVRHVPAAADKQHTRPRAPCAFDPFLLEQPL
jgi:hypothetical protein